jgi:hypothetical protein
MYAPTVKPTAVSSDVHKLLLEKDREELEPQLRANGVLTLEDVRSLSREDRDTLHLNMGQRHRFRRAFPPLGMTQP